MYEDEAIQQLEHQSHEPKNISPVKMFFREMFAGILGGTLNVVIGHPLDTIRVRIQNQIQKISVFEHLRKGIKNEGFFSLFRGMSSPLSFLPLYVAINFSTLRYFRHLLDMKQQNDYEIPEFQKLYIAGCLSGIISCIVGCPMELYKVVMQTDRQSNEQYLKDKKFYKSSFEVAVDIQKKFGFWRHYRGMVPFLIRDVHGYGLYYLSYYYSKYRFFQYTDKDTGNFKRNLFILFSGSIGGICGWLTTYPADVLKTKIQQDYDKKLYNGIVECLQKSKELHGSYKFLFNGLGTTLVRSLPVNGAVFLGYEVGIQLFDKHF